MNEPTHPMLTVDKSDFTKNFNFSSILAKIAISVVAGITVHYITTKVLNFAGVKKKG